MRLGLLRLRLSFVILLILGLCSGNYAQSNRAIQIANANAARGLRVGGDLINRLVGNVILYHNGTKMTCDSAYIYPDQRFEAFGRVRIIKDSTVLIGQYLEYDSKKDEGKMSGRIVRMIDGKTTLKTPVILFNTSTNNASFDQGATVETESISLESEKGYYNSQSKVFVFFSQVQLRDKEYEVISDSMHYDNANHISSFFKKTYIWHKDGFLSCNFGRMNTKTDEFHFSKDAYIQTKDQEIWSDVASFNRKTSVGTFEGNIEILDTTQGICLFGNYAHFLQKEKSGYITKQPVIGYFSKNPKEDTLFMASDTLRLTRLYNPEFIAAKKAQTQWDSLNRVGKFTSGTIQETTVVSKNNKDKKSAGKSQKTVLSKNTPIIHRSPEQMRADSIFMHGPRPIAPDSMYSYAKAYHNVKAFRKDIQWRCDSLNYASKDSMAELFVDPVIWSDGNQITADKMELYVKNKQMDHMEFTQNVFISSLDDSIKKLYNQVKGKSATGYFKNNELYRYDIFGNSQSVYFMRDRNKLTGVNFSESTDMKIYLKNRAVQRINYLTKPDSRMIPRTQMDEETLELKGFSWRVDIRPKNKQEVCPYPRRLSQRKLTKSFKKPTFPITQNIKRLSR